MPGVIKEEVKANRFNVNHALEFLLVERRRATGRGDFAEKISDLTSGNGNFKVKYDSRYRALWLYQRFVSGDPEQIQPYFDDLAKAAERVNKYAAGLAEANLQVVKVLDEDKEELAEE